MLFIKLTDAVDGDVIYLRASDVYWFKQARATLVMTAAGDCWQVQESAETVLALLNGTPPPAPAAVDGPATQALAEEQIERLRRMSAERDVERDAKEGFRQ